MYDVKKYFPPKTNNKEHNELNARILVFDVQYRQSLENLGEFNCAKRQKFWILAVRADILYPSDVSGILYPSH